MKVDLVTFSINYSEPPVYIAVSRYGYGMDQCPAKAILQSQEFVPLDSKPAQLLIYRAQVVWEDEQETLIPIGFNARESCPIWQNGCKPRLVGLTNTHAGWTRRPKI